MVKNRDIYVCVYIYVYLYTHVCIYIGAGVPGFESQPLAVA